MLYFILIQPHAAAKKARLARWHGRMYDDFSRAARYPWLPAPPDPPPE
jgi:hypothetical protein